MFAHYIIKRPRAIDDGTWSLIITYFLQIQEHLQNILGGSAGEGKPVINREDDFILFNGIGDKACEDFRFRKIDHDRPFYIKTNKLPYDLAVQVGLIVLKKFLGEEFIFETQGGVEDWAEAIAMFKVIFDEDPPQLYRKQGFKLKVNAFIKDMTIKNKESFIHELKTLLDKHSEVRFITIDGEDID